MGRCRRKIVEKYCLQVTAPKLYKILFKVLKKYNFYNQIKIKRIENIIMNKIFGIFSGKIIEKENIYQIKEKIIQNGLEKDNIYLSKNMKRLLFSKKLLIVNIIKNNSQVFTDDEIIVTIDGEIYNCDEMIKDLTNEGYKFKNYTESEVIAYGYAEYGDLIFNKLNGVFSIVIYIKRGDKLILVRDKFGSKPLFYYYNDNEFIFSSELNDIIEYGIKKEINNTALNTYFALTYIPAPYTIYKNVNKIEAGSYVKLENNTVNKKKYYNFSEKVKSSGLIKDYNNCKKEIKQQLFKSIEKRIDVDKKIGLFLSGGIDSSILANVISKVSKKRIHSFTIGYNVGSFDESKNAELVAKYNNTYHHSLLLDYKEAINSLDYILFNFGEPYADSSVLAAYYVSKLAKEEVEIAFGGDGADELFAGYEKYLIKYYRNKYNIIPKNIRDILIEPIINKIPQNRHTNNILRKVKKVINSDSKNDFIMRYNMMCLGYNNQLRAQLFNEEKYKDISYLIKSIYNELENLDELTRTLFTDMKVGLEGDMIPKIERTSNLNSLIVRMPFLDPEFIEMSFMIPNDFKLKGNNKKYILKETFKDILPRHILNAPKHGFGVPVGEWLKKELKNDLLELTERDFIENQGLFKYKYIEKIIHEHLSGINDFSFQLWTLFVFQKWYKRIF